MYRADIDGLRAVAIGAVILNHIDRSYLPNGHLGVDIFYVISGFVISQSLSDKRAESLADFVFAFFDRRVRRLLPALVLCVAATSAFVLAFIAPDSALAPASLKTGVSALFGLSNFYLLRQAADYFSSSAELNPFTHTWSLGVEEQFYFVFPFIVWYCRGGTPATRSTRTLVAFMSAAAAASFALYVWLSATRPIAAFYLMPTRFWEIAVGVIAFLLSARLANVIGSRPRASRASVALAAAALAIMLCVPATPDEIARTIVVLASAVLVAMVPASSLFKRILTLPPLTYVGRISYSLYLWHWSVLTIGRWTTGIHAWLIPGYLAAIFLLAALSYELVEKPLRRRPWPTAPLTVLRPLRAVPLGVIGAAAASALIMLVVVPLHAEGRFYAGSVAAIAAKGVASLYQPHRYERYVWSPSACVLSSNGDVGHRVEIEGCTFGDFEGSARRFLVIGDSFAAAEIEMLEVLVREGRGALTVTSSWGASPTPEVRNDSAWSRANEYYWRTVVPPLIDRLRRGDVILLLFDGAEFSPPTRTPLSRERLESLRSGLERFAEEARARGIIVVYQAGLPFIRESNCTPDTAKQQWWNVSGRTPCRYYSRSGTLERRREYQDMLLDVQSSAGNFAVFDPFDLFCPLEACSFFAPDGEFLYRDEWSHASVEASRRAHRLLLGTVDGALRDAGR